MLLLGMWHGKQFSSFFKSSTYTYHRNQQFPPLSLPMRKHMFTQTYTWTFIKEWFPIAPNWKQPQGPLHGEWINTAWSACCYYAIKRHEVLIHATMWMQHRNTVLSERSHTENTTKYMIPCLCNTFKTTETESRSITAWVWVGDGIDYQWAGGNFGGWWKCFKLDCIGFTTIYVY